MKIWMLNHYATEASSDGMWGRYYNLALGLSKNGHDVTVVAAGFMHNKFEETRLYKDKDFDFEKIQDINYVWLKTFPYYKNNWRRILNIFTYGLRLYKWGKRAEKPDLIIASSFHPLTWLSAYKLSKLHQARFVVEVRDLWPETPICMGVIARNSLIARIMRRFERFIYTIAEKIIVVLPYADKYIATLGIPVEKVVYIPNGADPALFEPGMKDNKQFEDFVYRYPDLKNKSNFKVIYTGAHGNVNCLITLVKTAKELQDKNEKIHFYLIGSGPEKEGLIKTAQDLKLQNITFCEQVPKIIIPDILAMSDAPIILWKNMEVYKYGVSANKLFDYMASRRPIVYVGNSPNIIDDAECGISVVPENVSELARALINLSQLSNEKLLNMGENGYRYFRLNHTYDTLTNKLEEKVVKKSIFEV
ncbi:MAG: glycosyltransferase family 4 protein [Syntrophomonas sp.]